MRTIEWRDGIILTLDQTRLPHETVFLEMKDIAEVAEAIKTMKIRGAPLLGATAAFALAQVAYKTKAKRTKDLICELENAAKILKNTRPTAVNLFWAIDRIIKQVQSFSGDVEDSVRLTVEEAQKISDEDARANHAMGRHGAELISDGDTVLTHCNAGALATVEFGTALGVIKAAWSQGKKIKVIATETRPKLQGARLTAYELKRAGIPVTLITDNMVGYVMYRKQVSKVMVGADRIVKDAVVNKIGTYTIAALAGIHSIPFYVVAPRSTFDLTLLSGDVTIEERDPEEVTHIGSQRIAVEEVNVLNPAFDITPLKYVTAIICEDCVLEGEEFVKLKANSQL